MKNLNVLILCALMISFSFGCSDNDPDEGPGMTECDPLEDILGVWTLDQVDASNALLGSDTDSMPTGNIEFFDDGTAIGNYSFKVIINLDIMRNDDTIAYVLDPTVPPTFMDVVQSDGVEVQWTIESTCDDSMIASFVQDFGIAEADVRIHLSR